LRRRVPARLQDSVASGPRPFPRPRAATDGGTRNCDLPRGSKQRAHKGGAGKAGRASAVGGIGCLGFAAAPTSRRRRESRGTKYVTNRIKINKNKDKIDLGERKMKEGTDNLG
jgi:hypothetical protein